MGFQDAAFLPTLANFFTTFHKIVVEVEASRLPHVIKLWFGVNMGMLPVKYF